HEMISLLTSIEEQLGAESRFVHIGLTTNDVWDTALALQCRDAADLLIAGQEKLRAALGALAIKHKDTLIAGRTHGVHAEPTTLAIVAASLEKIALELRGLQRTEVLEAQEPFGEGQKGSSAMPHKRNPELAERICGLARLIRTNAQAALENVALWHERDISHSSVERVILPDSTILLDYLIHLTTF